MATAAETIRIASQEKHARPRMLSLDGVRGLAIIGVLLTHASYVFSVGHHVLAMGWVGVDLFFVLSGFLITGILIDTKAARNRAQSFYARRVLRIFPIYYLTIYVVLIAQQHLGWVRTVAEMQSWAARLPYLFYYKNLTFLWQHGNPHQTLLSHFWSLAGEEQFYFLWPLVVWRLSSRNVFKICAAALGFTLALRIILGFHFGYGAWMQFFPLTRSDGLFVGAGLAALLASGYRFSRRQLQLWASAGLGSLLVVALVDGKQELLYSGRLMSTIGFSGLSILFGVLIAHCIAFHSSPMTRFFEVPWMRTFGRYSYGMYVYHLPVYYVTEHFAKQWFSLAFPLPLPYAVLYLGVLVSATYGLAWLSFRFFEQKFLMLKDRFAPKFEEMPIAATVA